MFETDEEDFSQSYKDFKKSVLHTIEEIEIEKDENYPGALFTVDKDNNAKILHLAEIAEEEEEGTSLEEIVHEVLPDVIRKNNSKYFAFAFSGEKSDGKEDQEIVAVVSGDIWQTDMVYAEVKRGLRVYAELEPWKKEDYMSYSQLVAPLRQGVVWQG